MKIYIGYDSKETLAYHVLAHSILRRASRPVSISPIALSQLESVFTRPRDSGQSTEFTYSRFLTPYFSRGGTSVFLDCDMLCLDDITKLDDIAYQNPYADCFVVKHDYTPRTKKKFLNQKQTTYPCKNWSSMMVFNGHRSAVRNLTPEYVNAASGMELHQFKWASTVDGLDKEWNHLVGEYPFNPCAKIVHFTLGGPWFEEYKNCDYAQQWRDELSHMLGGYHG